MSELPPASVAVVLVNNREAANISLNTSREEETYSIFFTNYTMLSYDLVVALLGPHANYLGVFNISTFGGLKTLVSLGRILSQYYFALLPFAHKVPRHRPSN